MMRRIPTLAFLMIALAATALSGCDQPDRTIVIVADDMEFRGGNPLLKANPGERVRLIFKNEAKGIIHEISIPQLKVKSERLMPGEEQVLNFIVPKDGGEFEYICVMHPMMIGRFVVRHDAQPSDENVAQSASMR